MATNISKKLNVIVSASTAGLKAGLNSAAGMVANFRNGIGSLTSRLGGMHAMLAAAIPAVTLAGLGALVKGQMEAIDSTAKLSDRLGISTEAVAKTLEDIRKAREQAGMTENEKKLDDLRRQGASPEQLAQAQGDLDQTDKVKAAQEAHKKMADAIKELEQETRTPLQVFEDRIEELYDMLANGLDVNAFDAAVTAAKKTLADANKTTETKRPDLMLAGSAAAQRLAYENSSGNRAMSNDKQLEAQRKANDILKKIEGNTGRQPAVVTI